MQGLELEDLVGEVTDFNEIAQEIADKSIKVVCDYNKILPVKLKKGAKILLLNMLEPQGKNPVRLEGFFEREV